MDSDEIKVVSLNKRSITDAPADPFTKAVESHEQFDSLSPVFKSKITRNIKKRYEGKSGAQSKRVEGNSFIDGYDTFDVVEPPHNLESLAKLYEKSSPHYAAVNAKVANIVGLGFLLVETPKSKRNLEKLGDDNDKREKIREKLQRHREEILEKLDGMNEEDSFLEILEKVWRDYEAIGNCYIEVGRNKDGTIGYIGHIPAQTMRIRKSRDGFVQLSGFEVQFFANFGAGVDENGNPVSVPNPIGNGKPSEVIHLKNYSPTSGYYGIPDIIAATHAIAGNEFAARFNLDYFENKAVPRYIITLKGGTLSSEAEQRLLSFFETGLKGQNHRSIYVPLPADTPDNKVELSLKPVEAGVQDSSFNNYRKSNLSDILMAHRVPISKVSVSENLSLAIARDADKTFKEQVCAPRQRILEKKLNKIFSEFSDALQLKLNEMSLTDENTQSQIDERRRKTGTETANEQRARRGEPAIAGGDELFDMNGKSSTASAQRAESTTNRERDSERSAGATDSAGEGRNPKGDGRTVS